MTKTYRIHDPDLIDEVRKENCALTGEVGCEFDPIVVHHLKTVGSRGPDVRWNLLPMKMSLHTPVIHVLGISKTAEKYPRLKAWLEDKGWQFNEFRNKWFAP